MLSIPEPVSQITAKLEAGGFDAYLVGGCVRDLLMGRTPVDWDVTTNATPEQIITLFPKTVYTNEYGTVTVVDETAADSAFRHIEITPFRLESGYTDKRHPDHISFSPNLEDDLKRRDFTINALAYSVSDRQIIDLYDGQRDIKDKIIRAVGDPDDRFQEDALRMLRAVRLASELGFLINQKTADGIKTNSNLLQHIAAERIQVELNKLLMSARPMLGLELAQKLGLLTKTIPELEEGLHVEQNGEHKYDVWNHIIRVVQHASVKNYGLEVRWACLFHDIGKPRTRRWSAEKKDWTFYGHEIVGEKMALKIMKRLKFSTKAMDMVAKLVKNHMFFSDTEKISLSAVRRVITRVGRENINLLMEVRHCDRIGMGRPKESPYRLRKYKSMIEEALRSPTSVAMLNINGNDVIRETGLIPSPKIGFILHALLDEVLEQPELNTADYLTERVKKLAKLSDLDLKKLGDQGKETKDKLETAEIEKIRAKFYVK